MSKWKRAFEHTPLGHMEGLLKFEFVFGPPATSAQISAGELALGMPFPSDLRELLGEFNGVWYTTEDTPNGRSKPEIVYLDIDHITARIPSYFRTCGNELPPVEELQKFVFFSQNNGFACLWGLCIKDVQGVKAGQIAALDEECVWKKCSSCLAEFVGKRLPTSQWEF